MHSIVARHQDFRDANKTLKMQGVPIKTLKIQGNANKTLKMREKMTPILWRRRSMLRRLWRCRHMPRRILTLHEHAYRREMMQHRLQIYNLSSFWRKLTSSDFRDMMWNCITQKGDDEVQILELWSGTNSEMWENVHRRWAIPWRLHFLQRKLEILFYYTTKH